MPPVKQASKQKRTNKAGAVKVLGAAGLGFSLVSTASASAMPTAISAVQPLKTSLCVGVCFEIEDRLPGS